MQIIALVVAVLLAAWVIPIVPVPGLSPSSRSGKRSVRLAGFGRLRRVRAFAAAMGFSADAVTVMIATGGGLGIAAGQAVLSKAPGKGDRVGPGDMLVVSPGIMASVREVCGDVIVCVDGEQELLSVKASDVAGIIVWPGSGMRDERKAP